MGQGFDNVAAPGGLDSRRKASRAGGGVSKRRIPFAVLSLLVFAAAAASAAEFRILAGPAWGRYADAAEMDQKTQCGHLFGAGFETGTKRLTVEVDVLSFLKTSAYPSRGWAFEMQEISVPVLIKLHHSAGPLSLSLGAGGELAFVVSHRKYCYWKKGDLLWDVTDSTEKLDYGLVFCGGAAFRFGRLSIGVETRYHHGLARTTHELNDHQNLYRTREFVVLGTLGLAFGKKSR